MKMNSTDEEAYKHFRDTLHADLRQNIKPVIISLTMLAEDYQRSSEMIVKSIEEYIRQVPSELKLLGLYLMDSIMKNLKATTNYIQLFEKNIIHLFSQVFECVDEQNRKAMYKLRQTWNEVFPVRILYDIDVCVKKIDPAWPITAALSGTNSLSSNTVVNSTNNTSSSLTVNEKPVNTAKNFAPNASIKNNTFNGALSSISSMTPSTTVPSTLNKITTSLQEVSKDTSLFSVTNSKLTKTSSLKDARSTSVGQLIAPPSATARDPRLQRKTKPSPQEQEINANNSGLSPTKKTLLASKQSQEALNQTGIKRTSPNSAQNPNDIKKPKYAIGSTINKPNNIHDEKMIINIESPNKSIIKTVLAAKKPLQVPVQQQQLNNVKLNTQPVNQQTSVAKIANPQQLISKSVNNEPTLVKSPKQKQTSPQQQQQQTQPRFKNTTLKNKQDIEGGFDFFKDVSHQQNEKMQISATDSSDIENINKSPNQIQTKANSNINNNINNNNNNGKKIPSLFEVSIQQPSGSIIKKPTTTQQTTTITASTIMTNTNSNNQNVNTTSNTSLKPKLKTNIVKNPTQQQTQNVTGLISSLKSTKNEKITQKTELSNGNDAKKLSSLNTNSTGTISSNTNINASVKATLNKKTLNSNLVGSKQNIQQQKTLSKPNKNLEKIYSEDENNLNYENDVDERFITQKDSIQFNQQIESINTLISSKSSLPQLSSSTKPTSIEQFINSTSTTSEAHKNQNNTVLNTLKTNSNSLNELEERLKKSNEHDKTTSSHPSSSTSSSTEELLEMIKTLVKQQQLLLEQQNIRNQEQLQQQQQPPPPPPALQASQPQIKSTNSVEPPPSKIAKIVEPVESESNFNNQIVNPPEEPGDNSMVSSLDNQLNDTDQPEINDTINYNEVVTYNELPPIRPKDKNENQTDSLLIIDGRSFRIQPDVRRLIKIYYHDHELFCDTRTKDVYVDTKRVYKMGDTTKEIMLNGRRVRLMYMGKRIELWIDGTSFHFRADSPPKQITLTSSQSAQLKRFWVTIDSRTMDMYFNNYKVCKIGGGPHGNGPNIINARLSPDDYETHEISFVCPPKRIMIDGIPRKMRYDLAVPCIEMDNGQFHIIRFSGPPKDIFIDDQPFKCSFDKTSRIKLNGRAHELAWGGPGYEVIIDGRPYELQFNKPPREIIIGTRPHLIYIGGDAPDVKIYGRIPNEFLQENENLISSNHQQQQQPPPLMPLMSQPTFDMPPPSLVAKLQGKNLSLPSIGTQPTLQAPTSSKSIAPDVHELFKKLMDAKLLPNAPGTSAATTKKSKTEVIPKEEEKVPDLTSLDTDLLKKKYNGAISSLYSGIQCATCGNRFNQNETANGTASNRYSKHLDWHFRQNKKEKDEVNKAHSREWYYSLPDWVLYEELSEESTNQQENESIAQQSSNGANENLTDINNGNDVNNHNLSSMFDQSTRDLNSLRSINSFNSNGIKTCPATDDIGDSCCICTDPFEIFWFEEREEWHFRDAIRVDNRIYHPICFEDAREDNVPTTPGPNKSTSQSNINTEILSSRSNNEHNMSDNSLNKNLFYIKNEPNDSQSYSFSSQTDLNQSSQSVEITETTNLTISSLDNTANDQDISMNVDSNINTNTITEINSIQNLVNSSSSAKGEPNTP